VSREFWSVTFAEGLGFGWILHHSVQKLLSSRLLSKDVKIRTYKIIILHVVLCGCETWSLSLREEHRLRVFENRGVEKNIWTEEGLSNRRFEITT
jgi:hypothetical protein